MDNEITNFFEVSLKLKNVDLIKESIVNLQSMIDDKELNLSRKRLITLKDSREALQTIVNKFDAKVKQIHDEVKNNINSKIGNGNGK